MTVLLTRPTTLLTRIDRAAPALRVTGRDGLVIKAGTVFAGRLFADDAPVAPPAAGWVPGADYAVAVTPAGPCATRLNSAPSGDALLGGFHFAPGSNAPARAGGDTVPAINPFSLWDIAFRPACPDPRGMTLVPGRDGKFWCDIYLTGANHLADGTSAFGAPIADSDNRPKLPNGRKAKAFDFATATAVMAHHGKRLLSHDEFIAAAYGVTEKTSHDGDPEITGLDAPRTSKWGLMQATGNMWIWGHDGDPDEPRPSIFGGSWWHDDHAGSRYAHVGRWSDYSVGDLGARGRSDHLQPV